MESLGSYLPLFLIMALATALPFTLKRFRRVSVPLVVGEILAGILFGNTGFHLLKSVESIQFLSDLGFAILMFLSGMEVDVDSIIEDRRRGGKWYQRSVFLAVLIFLLTILVNIALCALLMRVIHLETDFILLVLLLSTTSLGVVVPILKERGILKSPLGQSLLLAALVADVATMLLLTVYFAYRSGGNVLRTLLIGLIFAAALVLYRVGKRFMTRRDLPGLTGGTAQIMIRISFFVLLGFVLLAKLLGVEVILGAFIAGLLVSLITRGSAIEVRSKMENVGYGFFIPIFFINAGAQFDLSAVWGDARSLYVIPIVLAMAFASKVIPALVMRTHTTWRNAAASGFLLSSRMSLIIAASAIALQMGLTTELMSAVILVAAILTCTLSPMFFDKLYRPESPQKCKAESAGEPAGHIVQNAHSPS